MKTRILLLSVFLFAAIGVYAQKNSTELVGTWKLLSAQYDGEESILSKDLVYMKFYTKSHFCSVLYMKEGLVKQAIGGTYTFSKGDCTENVTFVDDQRARILNTKSTFKITVKKDKMEINGFYGDGTQTLREVWEKVE